MGTSAQQPSITSLNQQQQYGVGASSQYQQPLAGPMPPGKPPEQQFAGYGGMSGGMMSGGGMTAMAGPPMSNSTAGIVLSVLFVYHQLYMVQPFSDTQSGIILIR